MAIQELQLKLNHITPEIRDQVIKSLLELANHEAYGLLMYAANNHFSPETRRSARKASLLLQKQLFSSENVSKDSKDSNLPTPLENFLSEDSATKLAKLKQLSDEYNLEEFNELVSLLHKEQDPEVLPYLIKVCADKGGENSVPHITNFLRSGNPKIRQSVIQALSKINLEANYALLVRFTRDPDQNVRQQSLKAVSNLSADALLQCLTEMVKKNNDFNKDAVIFVIARLAFQPGFDLLSQLCSDESDAIQERAKMALNYLHKKGISTQISSKTSEESAKSQEPQSKEKTDSEVDESDIATDELEEQLGTSDAQQDQAEIDQLRVIRQGEEASAIKAIFNLIESGRLSKLNELKDSVIERNSKKLTATFIMALAQSKDKNHKPFLIDCLSYPDGRVQANAIEALRMLGCDDAKTDVLPFINDSKYDRARANAIIFLHPTGMIDTNQELQNMLMSKNDNRKLSAIFAIMDLFEPQFINLLEGPIDSPNPVVTKRALEALRLFVLDKQKTAVALAEKWKVMEEIISDDSEAKVLHEESSEVSKQESMEDLVSSLDDSPSDKKITTTPNSETLEESDTPSESKTGLNKIKSFMKNLLKK